MKLALIVAQTFLIHSTAWTAVYTPGSLYPQNWKQHKLEDYEKLDADLDRPRQLVTGGKVISAGLLSARAVAASQEVLKQGGSAADAALAGMMTEITISAGRFVSFAGIMSVLYYNSETNKVENLSAGYGMPKILSESGLGSGVLIPGFMAGVEALHKKYGRLPFAAIFEPSIGFAENGFVMDERLGRHIKLAEKTLTSLPGGRQIFLKPDGTLYKEGERFVQPQLAQTLRQVAEKGAAYMYSGDWGQKLIELVWQNKGGLSQMDLNHYKAFWEEPFSMDYKGTTLYVPGKSDLGGAEVLEAMSVVQNEKYFENYGDPNSSLPFLYWLMRVTAVSRDMSMSMFARALYGLAADPVERVSNTNIADLQAFLKKKRAPNVEYKTASHSSAFIVADAQGNIVVAEHTMNTELWGSTGFFVDGVSISDSAFIQAELVEMSSKLEHLPNIMNPVLVMKDQRPYILSSCINSALLEHTVQHLIDLIDLDLNPFESLQRSKFDGKSLVKGFKNELSPNQYSDEFVKKLSEMGVTINVTQDASPGLWIGAKWNVNTQSYEGATTSRLKFPTHIEIEN